MMMDYAIKLRKRSSSRLSRPMCVCVCLYMFPPHLPTSWKLFNWCLTIKTKTKLTTTLTTSYYCPLFKRKEENKTKVEPHHHHPTTFGSLHFNGGTTTMSFTSFEKIKKKKKKATERTRGELKTSKKKPIIWRMSCERLLFFFCCFRHQNPLLPFSLSLSFVFFVSFFVVVRFRHRPRRLRWFTGS